MGRYFKKVNFLKKIWHKQKFSQKTFISKSLQRFSLLKLYMTTINDWFIFYQKSDGCSLNGNNF